MKYRILKIIKKCCRFFLMIISTIISLIRIILYSKFNTKNKELQKISNNVLIFGNGESLKEVIDNHVSYLSSQNIIVVNDFFLNEHFVDLKPKIYIIADPAYWEKNISEEISELCQMMQKYLSELVTWDMFFYVPAVAYKTHYFQEIFRFNKHIKIQSYNTIPFKSSRRIRYFFYDKLLAKPYSGNVIGSALFVAMQMNVREIFLFGVEHSWTQGLYVDDQNRTCLKISHFHGEQEGRIWYKSNGIPYKIDEALFDIAVMLGGYREINEYAEYMKIRIFNCTKDSFIDAFDRKNFFD